MTKPRLAQNVKGLSPWNRPFCSFLMRNGLALRRSPSPSAMEELMRPSSPRLTSFRIGDRKVLHPVLSGDDSHFFPELSSSSADDWHSVFGSLKGPPFFGYALGMAAGIPQILPFFYREDVELPSSPRVEAAHFFPQRFPPPGGKQSPSPPPAGQFGHIQAG